MEGNIYLDLTRQFNEGKTRVIISSGQAVVLHRLAIMSKDGDWIVREDPVDLGVVLGVLQRRGAVYRFGAPLDARWLAGGWSSHFDAGGRGPTGCLHRGDSRLACHLAEFAGRNCWASTARSACPGLAIRRGSVTLLAMMIHAPQHRSEFLSEEDIDLENLSWEELLAVWNHLLRQAQATNEADRDTYTHGVFITAPPATDKRDGRPCPA